MFRYETITDEVFQHFLDEEIEKIEMIDLPDEREFYTCSNEEGDSYETNL